MIQRGRDRRLDAVARTYLSADPPRSRLVVVAGEDVDSTAGASRAIERAASSLDLPTILLTRGSETVDMELGADETPPVVVYHHGRVRESQLASLKPQPPTTPGPDLLIWDLPRRTSIGMRSLYLMGLWAWSIRPRQLRCVVPPAHADDPPLAALRDAVTTGFEVAETDVRPEVLQRPGAWEEEATSGLFVQILQSMLASSRRAAPRGSTPKPAREERAWGWAVAIMFAFLAGSPLSVRAQNDSPNQGDAGPPRGPLVTVEVEGIDLDDPALHRRPDGTRISSGRFHLLRLEPGVGTRSEGSLSLTTPRAGLYARSGEEDLDWTPRDEGIRDQLLLDAPEFTLQVRAGHVRITPTSIVVTLADDSSVLPGKQGLMLTGVLVIVIVMLFLRASSMRRRLDRPYQSVRRRKWTKTDASGDDL